MIIPVFMLLCGCGAAPEDGKTLSPGDMYSGQQTTAAPEGDGADSTAPEQGAELPETSPSDLPQATPEQTYAPDRPQAPPEQTYAPDRSQATPEQTFAPDRSQAPPEQILPPEQSPALQSELPRAGEQSLENLIFTALEPVGSTMYVWGGGWNEADTGAGPEALSTGCSESWAEFAAKQDSSYDYRNHRYQIHDGLDCSGYIGWVLYNLFHTADAGPEDEGYVMKASLMAETFSGYGWGELISASEAAEWKPGDICSMSGHVWLSLGMCQDGSVLLLHANPPGVRLCGTASQNGERTDAVALAEKWMSVCYPEWYAKYPTSSKSASYLTDSNIMRWNSSTLGDAEGFQALSAEEIAEHFMRSP